VKLPSWRALLPASSLERDASEVKRLAIKYVKEETLDPLKGAGRFALFGAIGSVFVAVGAALLLLGSLRFLQEQFPVFRGTLSWIPYLALAVLAAAVAGLALWRVVAGAGERRTKEKS
jgi:hypothetical protein